MDIVSEFLYWNVPPTNGFPDSTLMIGVEFEIGGAYENWGFGVYRVRYEKDGLYSKKIIASGRSLETAIKNAREVLTREMGH
jgi:hypothetical protein